MKIRFTTAAANLTTTTVDAVIAALSVKVESTYFSLKALMPILKYFAVGYETGAAAAAQYTVWIDLPVQIQAVSQDGGSTTLAYDELKSDHDVAYRNFSTVTVPEFQAGKSYLVPLASGAVTDMIPTVTSTPIAPRDAAATTLDKMPVVSSHYLYMSGSKAQTRNAQTPTCIIFDVIKSAIESNKGKTLLKREVLAQNLSNSIM